MAAIGFFEHNAYSVKLVPNNIIEDASEEPLRIGATPPPCALVSDELCM